MVKKPNTREIHRNPVNLNFKSYEIVLIIPIRSAIGHNITITFSHGQNPNTQEIQRKSEILDFKYYEIMSIILMGSTLYRKLQLRCALAIVLGVRQSSITDIANWPIGTLAYHNIVYGQSHVHWPLYCLRCDSPITDQRYRISNNRMVASQNATSHGPQPSPIANQRSYPNR